MVVCYVNSLETLGNESRLRFTAELDYAAGQVLENTDSKRTNRPVSAFFLRPLFLGWGAPHRKAGGSAYYEFSTPRPPVLLENNPGGFSISVRSMGHA